MQNKQPVSRPLIGAVVAAVLFWIFVGGFAIYSITTKKPEVTTTTSKPADSAAPSKSEESGSVSVSMDLPLESSDGGNTAYREDTVGLTQDYLATLMGRTQEYISNNSGAVPSSIDPIRKNVDTGDFAPFASWKTGPAITSGTPTAETVYYASGHTCDPATNLMKSGTKRETAIVVLISPNTPYCISS